MWIEIQKLICIAILGYLAGTGMVLFISFIRRLPEIEKKANEEMKRVRDRQ